MKSKFSLSILFIYSLFLFSCESTNTQSSTGPVAPTTISPDEKSKWMGTYIGTLPCADCEGIYTEITLNEDESFDWQYTYKGKSQETIEFKGNMEWEADNTILVIRDISTGDVVNKYKFEPGSLTMLDKQGKIIEGNLASHYVLYKIGAGIKGKEWTLVELNSNPIKKGVNASLQLSDTSEQAFGSSSCNRYFGTYTIKDPNEIIIKGVGSTLMACPDMNLEKEFMKCLQVPSQYMIKVDTLLLQAVDGSHLLKFTQQKQP